MLRTNGTLPLLTALQALRITGGVITTPYSFVATTHIIWWNGCRPVFVDIEEETVAQKYREALLHVPGIRFFDDMPGVRHNYSYFPIFINAEEYGKTRDQLYFEMKEQGILGRRYFYPLISTFSTYRGLPSAAPENLPVATKIANEFICLPMHHELTDTNINRILECVVK